MVDAYTPWDQCRALGQGAFGEVRAARRASDNLEVALKRIKRGSDYGRSGLSYSALREVRVLRELRHPNVVALLDVFVGDEHLVLVLELLASTDLEGVIRKAREGSIRFKLADAKAYAGMLLEALNFLHDHNVLHRDLKPGASASSFMGGGWREMGGGSCGVP